MGGLEDLGDSGIERHGPICPGMRCSGDAGGLSGGGGSLLC